MIKKLSKKMMSLILCICVVATVFVMPGSTVEAATTENNLTGIGLAEFALQAYEDEWQYNYGSYGQMGSDGTRYSDCSGLIFAYLCWKDENSNPVANYSMPRGSKSQMSKSSESGSISSIPRTHGLLVVTSYNHIGVYIGNDQSIDNSTYSTDMLLRTVSEYSWVRWYKLDCIEYPTTGWYEFNGELFYYLDGEYVIDLTLEIDGIYYTFDSYGTPSRYPDGYNNYESEDETEDNIVVDAVILSNVNLKAEKSSLSETIATVASGTIVTVTNMDDYSWYKVELDDGTVGYIYSEYLQTQIVETMTASIATEEEVTTSTITYSVPVTAYTTTAVSVKEEDSVLSETVTYVTADTRLIITEKSSSGWYAVRLSDGTTGYINYQYLTEDENYELDDYNAITITATDVKKYAGEEYETVKIVPIHETVLITNDSNSEWYKVELSDGTIGYIDSEAIIQIEDNDETVSEVMTTTQYLNLRTGASVLNSVVTVLEEGVEVTVIRKSNAYWYKVQTSSGEIGYVQAQYLE